MKLQEHINCINPAILNEAKIYMQSEEFVSLKSLGYYYEGFMIYENKILFPEVVVSNKNEIQKYSCDCRSKNAVCVHIAAMFLGIEIMIQAGCADYHEAVKT